MHTTSGHCHPPLVLNVASSPLKRRSGDGFMAFPRKRARFPHHGIDFFDALPEDLVLLILSKLSSCAGAPSDLINVLLTYAAQAISRSLEMCF